MNCKDCKHAQWDKTATGRLRPTGGGRCTVTIEVPPLPQSMFWNSWSGVIKPSGGRIDRHNDLRADCHYYEKVTK
jgi:hypothetical protein